ncbi:protein translocase SEC61 complex subunit gamma [Methanoculleus bourgensis]|jgi:protein transport protein SEC61 subunit gamma-like protein|uniref:Preprotein translocase subunit SecE n=3 Tax=Methanoculleus bourgensis TaxID=83986 RepID=I7LL71_METBM|nr:MULTISPECIES: protein translocase SEC61 complex subunit gamma [Methanoculleus]NQS73669.1 protein translocase SEC61 complex subunit gamma [Methanoculleus sp.]MBT0731838.1 protein translocase SEC61 complex subunit gamma [Methanoculleus bourgensis]MDD3372085.1 protein translocase SEC61 complex subunit gamma [Methanoculleus bourgensis]NMA88920.1 protein translocase SEC61 complex subunit gamma [Methanoculleus bourgensis]CCJ35114.1 preprotein translocase subunit SecE [Methanoculleus bourgensis MS
MMDYKEKFKEAKSFKVEEEFFKKYWRVLKLARTPTRDEFSKIAIVAATGILLIGLVGFIIYEIMLVLPK